MAADVYSVPPHTGRGGWTWYTGSAGWTYRVALELLLGFRRLGNWLKVNPCCPSNWPHLRDHISAQDSDVSDSSSIILAAASMAFAPSSWMGNQ